MRINSICILGGGTAGFAVASILSRYAEISGSKFDIKVVYSEDIGTIGVGESTNLSINQFLKYLGLDDKKWMKRCDATHKTSIKFTDFNQGSHFYFPFGDVRQDRRNHEVIKRWFIAKEFHPEIYTPERVAGYLVPHTILAEKNKLTNDGFDLDGNTSYHFDSNKFGNILKEYSKKRGVKIINDRFIKAELNGNGSIKSLVCEDSTYDADLFVDCSGFRSLLLGQTMKEEFVSFSDTLINDKAIVAKIPYKDKDKQLKNYTDSVALKNGWCWHIPLWNHMSVGYVHSSKFATPEQIESEFFEHVGEVDYEIINYKSGRYKRGWVKNVVSVGLSYGFLEPLEGTGLASMFINSFRLLEAISKRDMNYTQLDRDLFNNSSGEYGIDGWKSQIESHYYLSTRTDSEYWTYVTEDIDYKNRIDSIFSYEQFLYRCGITRSYHTNDPGLMFIAGGMNYSPFSRAIILSDDLDDQLKVIPEFEDELESLVEDVKEFPSSYEFLRKNIYS